MIWLSRNAPSIEACAALVTAGVAVAALIGTKVGGSTWNDMKLSHNKAD